MEEVTRVKMVERVCVAKFDHTEEDCPTTPVEMITQETTVEISFDEALLMGFKSKTDVEATGTVQLGVGDGGGSVGD